MIRVVTELGGEKGHEAICPFCFAEILFFITSPVYCYKCSEELPPFQELERIIDYRIDYHLYGAEEYRPSQESGY